MILAKEKLKSKNKLEFISGITLNALFLLFFIQLGYYYFNDRLFDWHECLNLLASAINAVIAYFLLGDTSFRKRHVGTLDWYKNKLQIRYNMGDNPIIAISAMLIAFFSVAFFMYLMFYALDSLTKERWNINILTIQFYLSIIGINTCLLTCYSYLGKVVITQDQILLIDDVTDLNSKDKEAFKHAMASIIRENGVLRRIEISNYLLKNEKDYKLNNRKNKKEYKELLDKYK